MVSQCVLFLLIYHGSVSNYNGMSTEYNIMLQQLQLMIISLFSSRAVVASQCVVSLLLQLNISGVS